MRVLSAALHILAASSITSSSSISSRAMSSAAGGGTGSCASRVTVTGAGSAIVNGLYQVQQASYIPPSFAKVCVQSRWNPEDLWQQLNAGRPWWESDNGSYIYLNRGDGKWWMDSGETGLGLYIVRSLPGDEGDAPPLEGWANMGDGKLPLPKLTIES